MEAEPAWKAAAHQVTPFQIKALDLLLRPNVREPDGTYKPLKWDENTAFTIKQAMLKGMGLSLQEYSPKFEQSRRQRIRAGMIRDVVNQLRFEKDPANQQQLKDMLTAIAQDGAIEGVVNARK